MPFFKNSLLCAGALLLLCVNAFAGRPDIVVADFEDGSYQNWTAEGEAFGEAPATVKPFVHKNDGTQGNFFVTSAHKNNDRLTGRLLSPEFKAERRYLCFMIAGGNQPEKACVNLLVEGKLVDSITGRNAEVFKNAQFDLQAYQGKRIQVEILDESSGGWGHIDADHFYLSDSPSVREPDELVREIKIEGRYLNIPTSGKNRKGRMVVSHEGAPVRISDIQMDSSGEPDFWVAMEVDEFKGQTLRVEIDELGMGPAGLEKIFSADRLEGAQDLYRESRRPQYHFSPARGWMNDINGLFYDGKFWHLYFQHNPYGWSHANMHWGHAISEDLMHWREQRIALRPWTQAGGAVFSGSAAIDEQNTTGFGTKDKPAIVAAFTDAGPRSAGAGGEALFYSHDNGFTFKKYEGNPVWIHPEGDGRDPKIFWYQPNGKKQGHWVIVVYSLVDKVKSLVIFTSPDLKQWKRTCVLPNFYECAELYRLPVDGNARNYKWVIFGGNAEYLVGDFDSEVFTPDSWDRKKVFYGHYYAAQAFNNVPNGRVVQIGWSKFAAKDMPFNMKASIPTQMSLRTVDSEIRLCAEPVEELALLRTKTHSLPKQSVSPGKPLKLNPGTHLLDVNAVIKLGDAQRIILKISGRETVYDVKNKTLKAGPYEAPLNPVDGTIKLQVLADICLQEVFANAGAVFISTGSVDAPKGAPEIELRAEGGKASVLDGQVYELKSIWDGASAYGVQAR